MATVATPAQQLALFQLWLLLTTNKNWNHPATNTTTLTPDWVGSLPAGFTAVIGQNELNAIFAALRSTTTRPNLPASPTYWDVLVATQQAFYLLGTGKLDQASTARYDPLDPDCPPGFASILSLTMPAPAAASAEEIDAKVETTDTADPEADEA